MADGVELGVGYVSVIPAWGAGAGGKLAGPGQGIGKQAGGGILQGLSSSLGPAALTGIGAGLAAGIGAGVGLFKLGDSFDAEFDKIRVATGETGAGLEGLTGSFKDVLSSTATDFDSAGTAIATMNQKLDLTGGALEERSKQFLELSRITGTDLTENMDSGTSALQAWQVASEDQGATLDMLFRASQQSGASFSGLAGQLSDNSVVFKALGFDMGQATTVLAGLAKGGLDASDVMPALGKAVAAGAKDGKSAKDVYQGLIKSIKDAPNATKAAGIAYDVLGAKAGPKFAALVRSGKFSFDELGESIAEGSDTILGAGKDTQDFSEKFEILKNRVFVGLEPLASGVFDAVGRGMDNLGPIFDTVTGGISKVVDVFQTDGLEGLGNLIQEQAPILGQKLLDLGGQLYAWVQPQIEPLLGKAGELLGGLVTWVLEEGVPMLAKGIGVLIPAITDWLVGAKDGDGGALKALLDKAPAFIEGVVTWLKEDLTPALYNGGKDAGGALVSGIWEGILGLLNSDEFPEVGNAEVRKALGLDGKKKARGGSVWSGQGYIVGEEGPELFRPTTSGTIIPNDRLSWDAPTGMGGGAPLIGHVTVQQMPGEDAGTALRREIGRHQMIQAAVSSR